MQNFLAPVPLPQEQQPARALEGQPRRVKGLGRARFQDADVLRRAAQVLGLSAACLASGAWAQNAMPERSKASPTAQAFLRADADRDGKLSKEEATRLPAIADKFTLLDRNGDGFLDPEEFAVGYEAKG